MESCRRGLEGHAFHALRCCSIFACPSRYHYQLIICQKFKVLPGWLYNNFNNFVQADESLLQRKFIQLLLMKAWIITCNRWEYFFTFCIKDSLTKRLRVRLKCQRYNHLFLAAQTVLSEWYRGVQLSCVLFPSSQCLKKSWNQLVYIIRFPAVELHHFALSRDQALCLIFFEASHWIFWKSSLSFIPCPSTPGKCHNSSCAWSPKLLTN